MRMRDMDNSMVFLSQGEVVQDTEGGIVGVGEALQEAGDLGIRAPSKPVHFNDVKYYNIKQEFKYYFKLVQYNHLYYKVHHHH